MMIVSQMKYRAHKKESFGMKATASLPSVSAASITPSANVTPNTDVPVTIGRLEGKENQATLYNAHQQQHGPTYLFLLLF